MRHFLLRAEKLWAGLTNSVFRRALIAGVGATVEHKAALDRFSLDCIIDVGANRGQFATYARAAFPTANIIAFEPLQEPADKFLSLFATDPKVRLIRAAVGSSAADLVMHVTAKDDSSSLYEIADVQHSAFGSVVVDRRSVRCGPLGQFLESEDLGNNNLLKIDTQGYELEVLKGSEAFLSRFCAIYCELSFVELYKGQPLASEVIKYLEGAGFKLTGVYNQVTFKGGALQADMLFEPKTL